MTGHLQTGTQTNRRKFLKVIGGCVVLAAGGAGTYLATRDPTAARQPWSDAGGRETDPRRRALSYAILAPNPHNRQPWIVDLADDRDIILYCQDDRRLPETDPYDRQITIGLGAFLEILAIAAAQDGFRADIEPFPGGEPQPVLDRRAVARVRLVRDANIEPDPLFAQILLRRSNKEVFDNNKTPPSDRLTMLSGVARHGSELATTADPRRVERLRAIGVEAMRIEYTTPRMLGESIDLMRIGKRQINASPDGIDLGGPFLETLALLGQLDKPAMRDPQSYAWQTGLEMILEPLRTGTAYAWITSQGNSRYDQLAAGRDYVRLNLAATGEGIAVHPTSQALQEFSEMSELFAAIHNELDVATPRRVQMFARLGYAKPPKPSPRWPLATRIRKV